MKKSPSLLSLFGLLLAGGLLLLGGLSPRLEARTFFGTSNYLRIGGVEYYLGCYGTPTDCCVVIEPMPQP